MVKTRKSAFLCGAQAGDASRRPLDDLPPIDAILITHNHYDHLDLATLRALNQRHPCRIIAPLGNDTIINRCGLKAESYDWDDVVRLSSEIQAILVPAYHWSARGLNDRRMALWAGFVLETPDGPVYLVGDTAYREGDLFREIPSAFWTSAICGDPDRRL